MVSKIENFDMADMNVVDMEIVWASLWKKNELL